MIRTSKLDQNSKRIEWIDALKAISMLGVMLGHYEFFPTQLEEIYAPFLLAAFLFASGYTFHLESNFFVFFKKRVKTLLFPWLWMGLLTVLSRQILTFKEHRSLKKQLLQFVLQIRGNGDELWFLICIFGSSMLFYLIVRLTKKSHQILLITCILCLVSAGYSLLGGAALPWHLQMYGSASFFLALGYLFKNCWEQLSIKFINKKVLLGSVLLYAALWYYHVILLNEEAIAFYSYGNSIPLYFMISIVSMIMMVTFVKLIKVPAWLLYVGENTLLFYGLHGKLESLFEKLALKLFQPDTILAALILGLIGLIYLFMILAPVSYLINTYVPFLLGKTRKKKNIIESKEGER